MEAVGIGDLHFEGTLANYLDNHYESIVTELCKPLEYALTNGIEHVFLYGDISDKPRMSYEAHNALLSVVDKYSSLKFWIILGNHDMYGTDTSAGHSLELMVKAKRPNVRIFTTPTTVKIDNARVQFLPFPHHCFKSNVLNICHVDVAGAKNDNGRPVKSDLRSDAVIVAGHIHTAQQVRNTYYSGTLYQTRMGEAPNKGFHHIRYNSDRDYDIELIPNDPDFKLVTLVVESIDSLTSADPDPSNLYRLIIKDGVDISPSDWDHLNVVRYNSFKSNTELQSMVDIEHSDGHELQISIPQFLKAHLVSSGESIDVVNNLLKLRKSIIHAAA